MKNLDTKIVVVIVLSYLLLSFVTTTIDDFFLPGSQPLQSGTFISPTQCDNCHGGYDNAIEPAFTWRGSMMANAMRDPLYLASLTIANQDAVDAGDLCIRCHSPSGWLEGRSEPTDGTNIFTNSIDMEGVHCHFCHKMMDPESTNPTDLAYIGDMTDPAPVHGNGMFVVDNLDIRRGPYEDATTANHNILGAEFMTKSEMCATCHDVSNPVFSKTLDGTYQPNALGAAATNFDTYNMFHVERTYSEWKMSAYNSPVGIPSDAFGGNLTNVSSCQDCHMQDATGKGVKFNSAPVRNDLGIHDMTGGNTFIPELIKAQALPGIDTDAIDAGIIRARYMLQNAATMNLNVVSNGGSGFTASVEIINETGHKLPSGYPEGRRMWIYLEAYDSNDEVIWESGAYDDETAVLDKKDTDNNDTKIYECKLGMSQSVADAANLNNPGAYTAGESFHFALNNMVIKDNRIPPRGFTNANFESVQAAPVGYTYADGDYFDITTYNLPIGTYKVEAKLYYQTVSKEYIDFLDEKNVTDNKGTELKALWESHGKSAPELMEEAEFYTDLLSTNNELSPNELIKVYPNPASDFVNVKFNFNVSTKVRLDIYSINGSKIETVYDDFILQGNKVVIWNLSTYAKGTYIMKFNFSEKSVSRLIVIK